MESTLTPTTIAELDAKCQELKRARDVALDIFILELDSQFEWDKNPSEKELQTVVQQWTANNPRFNVYIRNGKLVVRNNKTKRT